MSGMRKLLTILFALFAFASIAPSQTLRERAETNPLDCALYLVSIEELQSSNLAWSLYHVGRYEDLIALKNTFLGFKELSSFGLERLRSGDRRGALRFADAAIARYRADSDGWKASDYAGLVELLIGVGKFDDAEAIASSQEETDDRATILLEIAEAEIKFGDVAGATKALQRFSTDFEFDDEGTTFRHADVMIKLGVIDKAAELLRRLENKLRNDPSNSNSSLISLIKRYYTIGHEKEAKAIWESISDLDDLLTQLDYVQTLIAVDKSTEALRMLEALNPTDLGDENLTGPKVAKAYVALGKTTLALRVAKTMSDDIDNYDQQEALMVVADQYIKGKNNKAAREVLDFTFQRAAKIVFEQEPQDSTSSGIRKDHYLSEIIKRYQEIGDLDAALKAVMAINADHPDAKEKLALNIATFAQANVKKLSQAKVQSLMSKALKLTDDGEYLDYKGIQVRTLYAESLAQMGQREKAVDVISDLIQKYADDDTDENALLLPAEIFEKYHLPVTEHLRKSLIAVLEAHE